MTHPHYGHAAEGRAMALGRSGVTGQAGDRPHSASPADMVGDVAAMISRPVRA